MDQTEPTKPSETGQDGPAPPGPGLSLSRSIPEGTTSTSRTLAVQKAAEQFARHGIPQRGAMTTIMVWFVRALAGIVFGKVDFDPRVQDKIRETSRQGQIVYVFQTVSRLDYLYFNWAFLKSGLPLAEFANGISTMGFHTVGTWLRHMIYRRARRKKAYDAAAFDHCVREGRPIWLFLDKALGDQDANLAFSQPNLLRLMQFRKRLDRPIHVLPLVLVWDKRPDAEHPSLIDDLFGTSQAPGFWRKGLQFLNMSWQSFFVFGSPAVQVAPAIELGAFREELPEADTAESAELLREKLEEILDQERQVIAGPPLRPTRDLKEDILRKQAITEAVRAVAQDEGVSEQEIAKRARSQLDEIAADFSLLWMKALGAALSPFFYLIYKGFHIDMDGLHRLREIAPGSRVVLVPSHKSHIDYLVISYVFYKYGLMPPHIAAGVNLSFWPIGPIFRHCGSFFLRRTFKGDALYPTVFRQYLVKLLEEGVMIEFFIEGTRSRTGKVIKPRLGMLRMILDAFIEGRFEELVFQPISIGYEKVIEGGSYRRESRGGEKEAESAVGLLKASSVLTSNYGRVFLEFGEPISLNHYLSRYGIDRDAPPEKSLQELTVRLGHRIVYDIAESTPVTPTSLVALVLLGGPKRGLGTQQMLREVGFVLHILLDPAKQARLSTPLDEALAQDPDVAALVEEIRSGKGRLARRRSDRLDRDLMLGQAVESVVRQAILLLDRNNLVEIREIKNELFYELMEAQRIELNYNRNTIVHFFVPEALLAAAIMVDPEPGPRSLDLVEERSLFLSRLFKFEFFYKERRKDAVERTQFAAAFYNTIEFFVDCGWIGIDRPTGIIDIPSPSPPALDFFRGLMLSYVEPYWFVTRNLDLLLDGGLEKRELIKVLLKRAVSDGLQGQLHHPESMTKPTFENVLSWLGELGVVTTEKIPGRRGRSLSHLRVDPEWQKEGRWEALSEQIAEFAGANRRNLTDPL